MFPDPNQLSGITPSEILEAAAAGHLGLDHRFLHAIIDRPQESLPAVVAFAERDRNEDAVDLTPELVSLFRYWKAPEGIPFLIKEIKDDPENVTDEVIGALVDIGRPALDPLLSLHQELDESQSGEVAFILASLGIRDDRILKILIDRLEYDLSDTVFFLGVYRDAAAKPAIEKAAAALSAQDKDLKEEIENTLDALSQVASDQAARRKEEPFDIWELYPEKADVPMDLLNEDERIELLSHPAASLRAAAANSFFNRELTPDVRDRLLALAKSDESAAVRARAWEALTTETSDIKVIEAMLAGLRNPEMSIEERGGLLVALAPEADRNEVRQAIVNLYENAEGRAKALEAMWRSLHPIFRHHFPKDLDDLDLEIRRSAVWGIGYYGLKSELDRLRTLFEDDDLRLDALFAYALALPGEVSRGRMKGLLARVEKDAHGLSEMEEELVKAALDERLMLAGKEPVFSQQED